MNLMGDLYFTSVLSFFGFVFFCRNFKNFKSKSTLDWIGNFQNNYMLDSSNASMSLTNQRQVTYLCRWKQKYSKLITRFRLFTCKCRYHHRSKHPFSQFSENRFMSVNTKTGYITAKLLNWHYYTVIHFSENSVSVSFDILKEKYIIIHSKTTNNLTRVINFWRKVMLYKIRYLKEFSELWRLHIYLFKTIRNG